MNSSTENVISWEYHDGKHRSPAWYIVALSLVLGIVFWGIFSSQYGLSFIVMLVAGIYYFVENNSDERVKVHINELGISIQNNFYDYASMQSFSLIYDNKTPVFLRLSLKKRAIGILTLKIQAENASTIQAYLSQFVEQKENAEISFVEKLSHFFNL